MKKIISLLLCTALLCGLAAGCSRERPEETEVMEVTETAAPTEWVLEDLPLKKYDGVTLVFRSSWAETSAEAEVLTQAAEVFEVQTGAAVDIQWSAEEDASGDIVQIPGTRLAEYADNLLDLTELAEAAGYAGKSFDCLTDQVLSRCGFLAGIPQTPYVSGFYYNREAFAASGIVQTPRTWSEFLEVCNGLTAAAWQPLTLNSESTDDLLLLHLTQYLGAEEARNVTANGGWEKNALALQASADILQLVGAGYLVTGTPAAAPAGQNKIGLSNGAIVYGTNAVCAQVEEAALAELDWGMFPYPGIGGAEPVIAVDSDVLAIGADCSEPQAAFDFIMLLTTGEFDQLRADLTNGIPADPNNESPVAGAAEAMQIAQVIEPAAVEFTEKQLETILKLWEGKYQENVTFARAMDQLYS